MEYESMMLDIPLVLEALGIDYYEKGAEANGLCPTHARRTGKEDHSPSWWINLDSGQHICFSCNYKGNLLQLICDVNEFYKDDSWSKGYVYDYAAAEEWLASLTEMPIERMVEIAKSLPNYIEPAPKPLEMNEARLAVFTEPPSGALEDRNITAAAAKKYSLMWDTKKESWILPLREPQKGTIHRTFFNRPTGLQKSKTLFGIENQLESRVIVVESPLDCVRLASAGIQGAVALCGSVPSEEQIKLIRYSEQVICALDNPKVDKAGYKGAQEMAKFARKYGLNLSFFNYGDTGKKDPGDLTNEELVWGVNNAKTALLGEKAYV
jgi:hypothetical protein